MVLTYLTNRTQYVSLSNHFSAFTTVHSDVPRGSVIGPIFFSINIKPLSTIDSLSHNIHMLMN